MKVSINLTDTVQTLDLPQNIYVDRIRWNQIAVYNSDIVSGDPYIYFDVQHFSQNLNTFDGNKLYTFSFPPVASTSFVISSRTMDTWDVILPQKININELDIRVYWESTYSSRAVFPNVISFELELE
jgi:hypothetical protein